MAASGGSIAHDEAIEGLQAFHLEPITSAQTLNNDSLESAVASVFIVKNECNASIARWFDPD